MKPTTCDTECFGGIDSSYRCRTDQCSHSGGNHAIGNDTYRRSTYYVKHITRCNIYDCRGCERVPGNAERYREGYCAVRLDGYRAEAALV